MAVVDESHAELSFTGTTPVEGLRGVKISQPEVEDCAAGEDAVVSETIVPVLRKAVVDAALKCGDDDSGTVVQPWLNRSSAGGSFKVQRFGERGMNFQDAVGCHGNSEKPGDAGGYDFVEKNGRSLRIVHQFADVTDAILTLD